MNRAAWTRALLADAPPAREMSIDVIRAFCIISMVFAHVAEGSLGYSATHAAVWFDGAMGFVLLAGLVIGMVQRKTIERFGLRAAQIKVLRRSRLVFIAHIVICVIAFAVAAISPTRDEIYTSVADAGGWLPAIWATLTLQINPFHAAILSLYVILLALTAGVSYLAARSRWALIIAGIVVLYIVGRALPELFTLPRTPGVTGEINWAGWQAIYFPAYLVGWQWQSIQNRLLERRVWLTAAVVSVVMIAVAQFSARVETPARATLDPLTDSGQMGPLTIVLAFTILAAAYPLVRWASGRMPVIAAIFARVGRRSLDCYIILSALVLIVPTWITYSQSALAANGYAAGVLLVMWVWCRYRDARARRKSPLRQPV